MTRYSFFVTVERGLEDLAIRDLSSRFDVRPKYEKKRVGKVFLVGDEDAIFRINFCSRIVNRLVLIIGETNVESLSEIEEYAKGIDWTTYIGTDQTFGLSVNRVGNHNFTSMDVARIVGSTILGYFRSSLGTTPRVNLSNPDVRIIIDIFGRELIVGIDTTGRSLHIRGYRVFSHPKALKTTMAYAMILLSGWKKNECLLDPTCGGGTIPIEAALYGRNIPICLFRDDYAFYRLRFLDIDRALELREHILGEIDRDLELRIYGLDINSTYLDGAKRNATRAGVGDTIRFIRGDATRLLDIFGPDSIDRVVFNPPYRPRERGEFYRKVILNAISVVRDGGRVVFISSFPRLERILRNLGVSFSSVVIRRDSIVSRIYIIDVDKN